MTSTSKAEPERDEARQTKADRVAEKSVARQGDRQAGRQAERAAEKYGSEFGGTAYAGVQEELDRINEVDERAPDRRPATLVRIDGPEVEVAEDNRTFAGDQGRAVNQMAGRAAITENHDPKPGVTNADYLPEIRNETGTFNTGMEVQLLRGYVPESGPVTNGQGVKLMPGEVVKLPAKEAKKLINIQAAKFTETDD